MADPADPTLAGQRPKAVRGRPFKKGQSGNPKGGPKGIRAKAFEAFDAMASAELPAIVAALISAAKTGDTKAAELLIKRVWPERKGGRPVEIDLPEINTAADLAAALGVVIRAMAAGLLSTEEAQGVTAILDLQRRAIETAELEQRIAELESLPAMKRGDQS
jgi:hypothetical protein